MFSKTLLLTMFASVPLVLAVSGGPSHPPVSPPAGPSKPPSRPLPRPEVKPRERCPVTECGRDGVVRRKNGESLKDIYERGGENEIERGGRKATGTLNNRSGGQTAAQHVSKAACITGLTVEEKKIFGEIIHKVKLDPYCPEEWRTSTGDLTFHALIQIAESVKCGESWPY